MLTPVARLDITTNGDGYFFIPGLQARPPLPTHRPNQRRRPHPQRYDLGDAAEPATVDFPQRRLYIADDAGPCSPRRRRRAGRTVRRRRALDAPTKGPQDGNGAGVPAPNRTKIAIENGPADSGGFEKVPVASQRVEIPGRGQSFPRCRRSAPPPVMPSSPPEPRPARRGRPSGRLRLSASWWAIISTTSPAGSGRSAPGPAATRRKLVLLDFWKSNVGPCLTAISHLRGLQEKYGGDGLEVVGIACDIQAALADRLAHVRNAKVRTNANYTILLVGFGRPIAESAQPILGGQFPVWC